MIWSFIKKRVADKNVTYKIRDVLHLTEEAFREVTPDYWRSCIRHCMEEEKKCAALENIDLNSSDVGQGSLDIPISDVDLEDEIDPTQGSESDVDDSLSESDCRDNQSDDEYFNAQNVFGNACTNKYGEDEEENNPEKARKKYDMNYNSHSNYCQFCPKVCKTIQGLANHLKVHQMTHFLREDGDAAKQCDLCEKVFYQTDGATATRQLLSHRRNCKGGIIKSKDVANSFPVLQT